MRLKMRIALLVMLSAAAVLSATGAYRSLRPVNKNPLPEDIYARFTADAETAQFFLKDNGGYVAIFEDGHYRSLMSVTSIETDCLRCADRAMLEAGIPVADQRELLQLLEDLGS